MEPLIYFCKVLGWYIVAILALIVYILSFAWLAIYTVVNPVIGLPAFVLLIGASIAASATWAKYYHK